VQRDVVVHQEDRPRPVIARVADVGQDAVESEGVKVPPAHLDDRAEAAIERATARGLDDIDLLAEELVAPENAGIALRGPDLSVRGAVDCAVRVVVEGIARSVREPRDGVEAVAPFERSYELAED